MTNSQKAPAVRNINLRDTAALVRQALHKAFPGVKFSVRIDSGSMYSAINIRWVDGPTQQQVHEITGGFHAGRFQGLTDCSYSADSWYCAKHGARGAQAFGSDTQGDNGAEYAPCCSAAELVHFGARFTNVARELSPAWEAELAAIVASLAMAPLDRDQLAEQAWLLASDIDRTATEEN